MKYNFKTVAASLKQQGLKAKAARKFSPVSCKPHTLPVFDNLLAQDFTAGAPNQKWGQYIIYSVPGVQGGHGCQNEPRTCLEY